MPKRTLPEIHQHKIHPTRSTTDPAQNRALAVELARVLADDKCDDVVVLDVSGLSQMSDFLVIASGTSDRQMRSALDDATKAAAALGVNGVRHDVDDRATWVLADFVDVVVHIFEPNTRAHYDLEMLWADAPRIAWERPGKDPRDRARTG